MKIYFGKDSYGIDCVRLELYGRPAVTICSSLVFYSSPETFFTLLSDKLTKEIGLWITDSLAKSFNRAK